MKKIYIALIIIVSTIFYSCTSSFDELNTNPDSPTKVKSSMLATNVILDMVKSASNWKNEFLVKRMFWGEQMDDLQYNRFGKSSFSGGVVLNNAQKMVELSSPESLNAYTGLFYFLKGWYFWRMTMDVGDIPYTQALNIQEYPYPKYDSQKDVFLGILNDLEMAEMYFSKAESNFEGDPFYNGDPNKWKKATNVLRLKVLMSLQKRADDTPELKVKETFAKIVSEDNLFESNDDNLQVVYSELESNRNPYHKDYTRSIEVYAATSMLVNPLKEYKDYRLFYYLEPAQALTDPAIASPDKILAANDWNAYIGLNVAGVFDEEKNMISSLMYSRPNDIYRLSYIGVPCIRLGYSDMNFILAEAAERGWINGNSLTYYEKGIKASFDFVRTNVPSQYNKGMEITDDYIQEYLTNPSVTYTDGDVKEEKLKKIWMQNYLAGYFHMATDAYYEYRRTGYPEFPINPNTNLNTENTKIPMRWLYPDSENNYNKEELKNALKNQWNGVDNVNNIMWILK